MLGVIAASEVAVAAPASYPAEVLADSPALYWRLGETSGTTAADASGNGRTGTYLAGTLGVTGALVGNTDKAYHTTQDTNQCVFRASESWMNTNTITYEIWAKWSTYDSGNGDPAVSRYTSSDGSPFLMGRQFGRGAVTTAPAFAQVVIGATRYNIVGSASIPNGSWVHLVFTYDGTTARLYLNGTQVGSQAASGSIAWSTSQIDVGRYSNTPGTVATADFDELAVYTTTLSPTRIAAHYAAGIAA